MSEGECWMQSRVTGRRQRAVGSFLWEHRLAQRTVAVDTRQCWERHWIMLSNPVLTVTFNKRTGRRDQRGRNLPETIKRYETKQIKRKEMFSLKFHLALSHQGSKKKIRLLEKVLGTRAIPSARGICGNQIGKYTMPTQISCYIVQCGRTCRGSNLQRWG